MPYGDVKSSDWFIGAVAKAGVRHYQRVRGRHIPSKQNDYARRSDGDDRTGDEANGAGLNVSSVDAIRTFLVREGAAVDAWAKQAVAAAVKNGLVKGSEGGRQAQHHPSGDGSNRQRMLMRAI